MPLARHAELRHRRHRFRGIERHGLGEPGGKALHPGIDRPLQAFLAEIFRQRDLDHLIAAGEGHVKPEGPLVEEARRHRPEAIFLADLFGDGAVIGVRVDHLTGEAVAALLLHVRQNGRQFLFQAHQFRRQLRIGRHVAGKGNGLADAGKEIAAALIAVQDFLDRPGDIVFGVAQLDLEILLALRLHLDQIPEAQGLELVAVLNEQIEIGVGHRRLVFARRLQGHRPDAVLLAGLLLQLRMLQRIDELDMDLAAAGHLIFLQQIADARHQRGEQGMGLGREIAADEQRLLELAEIGPVASEIE